MRFIFGFIFILFCFHLNSEEVRSILQNLPIEDRSDLYFVFSSLIKDQFAYTLFGNKPISLAGRFTLTPWENTIEHLPSHTLFWKRWQTWEKYKHLFPSKKYLLLTEECENRNYKIVNIILINKDEFIKTIFRYRKLFQKVLNKKVLPTEILADIEHGKISLAKSIHNNEMLWGILLGYGKHNAILYNKRERDYINYTALSQEELKQTGIHLNISGDSRYSPQLIGPVCFAADLDHPETIKLQNSYKDLRGKISAIYANGDLLEITLSQFTSID